MRKPSAKVAERNAAILARICELKAEHPFWGYRRLWAHLKFVDKLPVNKKRILRLLRQHDLLVKPNLRNPAIPATQSGGFRPPGSEGVVELIGAKRRWSFSS